MIKRYSWAFPACSTATAAAVGLLAIIFALVAMTSAIGVVGPWMFPSAVVAGLAAAWLAGRDWRSLLAVAVILICGYMMAALVVDKSFDGQEYHQEIIAQLVDGWRYNVAGGHPRGCSIFTIHYAKAVEMCAATIVSWSGNMESGKLINIILAAAALLMVYSTIKDSGRSSRRAWLYAALITLNPVLITQIFTYYNDYVTYCDLLITLSLIARIEGERRGPYKLEWTLLLMLTIFSGGAKLTALYFQGLTLIFWMLWALWRRRWDIVWPVTAIGLGSLIAVAVVFYHPYVTNLITKGHALYPLAGEDEVDIMSYNTPDIYKRLDNRFVNFAVSIFSPRLPEYDSRFAAFGPLFGVSLLISLAMIAKNRREMPRWWIYISICILASCFFIKQGWWGRYVPQVWLIPVVTAMLLRPKAPKWSSAVIVMVVLNIMTCGVKLTETAIYTYRQHWLNSRVESPVKIASPQRQQTMLLDKMGVEWERVDSVDPVRSLNWIPRHQRLGLTPAVYDKINHDLEATPWLLRKLLTHNGPILGNHDAP